KFTERHREIVPELAGSCTAAQSHGDRRRLRDEEGVGPGQPHRSFPYQNNGSERRNSQNDAFRFPLGNARHFPAVHNRSSKARTAHVAVKPNTETSNTSKSRRSVRNSEP